jgi:phosphatidylinositol phospholipase C delta
MSLVSTTTAPIDIKIDTSSLVLDGVLSASPSNLSTFDTQAIPKSEPPRGRRTRSPVVPPSLLKPGVDMLKVSVKSSRRIKSRKVWLEMGTRVGNYGVDDVQICWEKSTRGVGS